VERGLMVVGIGGWLLGIGGECLDIERWLGHGNTVGYGGGHVQLRSYEGIVGSWTRWGWRWHCALRSWWWVEDSL
jgi:hypothetical protein